MSISGRLVESFVTINEHEGAHQPLTTSDARKMFREVVAAHREKAARAAVALYVLRGEGHWEMVGRTVVGGGR